MKKETNLTISHYNCLHGFRKASQIALPVITPLKKRKNLANVRNKEIEQVEDTSCRLRCSLVRPAARLRRTTSIISAQRTRAGPVPENSLATLFISPILAVRSTSDVLCEKLRLMTVKEEAFSAFGVFNSSSSSKEDEEEDWSSGPNLGGDTIAFGCRRGRWSPLFLRSDRMDSREASKSKLR